MDTQYVNMLLALDGIPVCLIIKIIRSSQLRASSANPQLYGVLLYLDIASGLRAISGNLHELAGGERRG
jgi:hypothetical protein